ncbi:MAG: LytR C-terminal domain-containing protein, partial [bacterium]
KDKAFSFSTLLNPLKLNSLLKTYEKHISTNMEIWEIIKMSKLLADINLDEVATYVFDDSPQGVLYSDNIEGAYVLLPKTGDFSEMQFIINNIFTLENTAGQQVEQKEKATIEILNGTATNGLASQASVKLRSLGYQVNKLGNALTQDYEKTVIYDLTNGGKPKTIEAIKGLLNANVSTTIPSWLTGSWTELNQDNKLTDQLAPAENKIITQADILIILGQDQIK